MSEPQSKRKKRRVRGTGECTEGATTDTCKTVLFVCGYSPWKATLTIPRTKRISRYSAASHI